MKDMKGALGGKHKNTVAISKSQTSRTTESIVRNVKGSGNGPNRKGDKEILDVFLCEEKTTTRTNSIVLKVEVLKKITAEAMEAGKVPMLIASLENMPRGVPKDWAIIPLDKVPWRAMESDHDIEDSEAESDSSAAQRSQRRERAAAGRG